MNNNSNDNKDNNYNIYNTMNDDAFNVFNQNQQAITPEAPGQAQQVPKQTEQIPQPAQPVQPVAPNPNLVTVNDYKEPKKPFSFKDLLKKKIKEEEKTFNIDDITNYKDTTKKVDIEEVKEKNKKIKDIVILVVALVVLIIVGIVAYNVFTSYMLPSQSVVDSSKINKNIQSKKEINDINDVVIYNCDNSFDDTFYNLPGKEYIVWENYRGITSYSFYKDKLDMIKEQLDINYNVMDRDINNTILKYCNSYNKVLDQYVFLCTFSNSHMIITNTFYLNKIDGPISNNLGEYKIKYNNHNILGDIITSNTSCTLEK